MTIPTASFARAGIVEQNIYTMARYKKNCVIIAEKNKIDSKKSRT